MFDASAPNLTQTNNLTVSVIATVFNEGENMRRLLDSLAAQTRVPDEVVICDGGSRDNTVPIINEYIESNRLPNLRLLVRPAANISQGRNAAIAAAQGPIIAATDAGVRLTPTWLEALMTPFLPQSSAASAEPPIAVAGFFMPDVEGPFQVAMGATVLPLIEDIDPNTFLPSSRSVAFTKTAWAKAGGYPEWLDYCEDLLFDFAINAQQPHRPSAFAWAPDALVHFRPRTNLTSFWHQYYRYARGDGKADLWRKRHAIRYGIYLFFVPALVGHGLWGFFARWLGWLGLAAGVAAYCWRPWQRVDRLGRQLSPIERVVAYLWVPLIRLVGDLAKMAGYPVGVRWRQKER